MTLEWSMAVRMSEGSDAHDRGEPITNNPYKKGDSSLRDAWDEGWKLAAKEEKEAGELLEKILGG